LSPEPDASGEALEQMTSQQQAFQPSWLEPLQQQPSQVPLLLLLLPLEQLPLQVRLLLLQAS
jgi:hypothetical protein